MEIGQTVVHHREMGVEGCVLDHNILAGTQSEGGEIPQRLDSGGHRMVGGILGVFDRHGYHSYLSVERWTELFEPAHGIDLHSIDDFAGKAAVGVKSGHYMQAVVLQSAVGYEGASKRSAAYHHSRMGAFEAEKS